MKRWANLTVAEHADTLADAGLTGVNAFRLATGEFIKNHHGARDVHRLSLPSRCGLVHLFLKRVLTPRRRYLLHGLLRHGRCTSQSGYEWRNMRLYAKAGIATCKPVAYGAEFGLTGETFSFILTEAARGDPLDEWLHRVRDVGLRRRVLSEVAAMVARAHSNGVGMPALLGRHVFVDIDADQNVREVSLIDLDRIATPLFMGKRRARDLAQLHLSIPKSMLSQTERLRFLRFYDPMAGRPSLKRIAAMARHAARRRPRLLEEYETGLRHLRDADCQLPVDADEASDSIHTRSAASPAEGFTSAFESSDVLTVSQ